MSLDHGTASISERLESITLRSAPRNRDTGKGGGINVELQPRKGWRDLAKEGVASMRYRISAVAEIAGTMRHVNVFIPATHDNELLDLGEAENGKPFLLKNEDGSLKLCPKAGNGSFDSAGVAIDSDGKAKVGKDGLPVFTEPEILMESGEAFNLCFGTLYFVPSHNGLTLKLIGVSLHENDATKKLAPDNRPYVNVHADDVVIVPRIQFVPKGKAMGFGGCMATKQSEAAMKSLEAVEESI